MSIFDNKKELLRLLSVKENFLYGDFSGRFLSTSIPKKNGGERLIDAPNTSLKKVQRVILNEILKKVQYLDCVYGLGVKRNILECVRQHQKNANEFVLLLDIKDFFPSITQKKAVHVYQKIGFNKENSRILTKLTTFKEYIPQGAPTSCHLSSLCLDKLDKKIFNYCKRRHFVYTRYIDDITISGKDMTQSDIDHISDLINSSGYSINTKKRRLLRPEDKKILNNIVVSPRNISVTPKYLSELMALFDILQKEKTEISHARFSGKMGFYVFLDKKESTRFYNKLVRLGS